MLMLLLPVLDVELSGHGRQLLLPALSLNVPLRQGTQLPLSPLSKPARQKQSEGEEAPRYEEESGGQEEQEEEAAALLYVPAGQERQEVAGGASEK
eukprot:767911-Hanusia_phi.AAC.5